MLGKGLPFYSFQTPIIQKASYREFWNPFYATWLSAMVAILANARVGLMSIIQGDVHKNPHGFFEGLATRCLQSCIQPIQPQASHLERYSQSSLRHQSLSGLLCHHKRHEILFLPISFKKLRARHFGGRFGRVFKRIRCAFDRALTSIAENPQTWWFLILTMAEMMA